METRTLVLPGHLQDRCAMKPWNGDDAKGSVRQDKTRQREDDDGVYLIKEAQTLRAKDLKVKITLLLWKTNIYKEKARYFY